MDETSQSSYEDDLRPSNDQSSGMSDFEGISNAERNRLGAALRKRMGRTFPDADLTVAYALQRAGKRHLLSDRERSAVEAANAELARLERDEPFFRDVLDDISYQADDFESFWRDEVETMSSRSSAKNRPAIPRTAFRRAVAPRRRMGAFAALAAAVVMVVLLWRPSGDRMRIVADAGAVENVSLEDGSSVRLMPGAVLTFERNDAGATTRSVELAGDAYFVVAADHGRPFRVDTPDMTVWVTGTRFGIDEREAGSEIVLAAGEVEVVSNTFPDSPVTLAPGTKSIVRDAEPASQPVTVDVIDALRWTGLFVFRGETYETIAAHLARHYGIDISADPDIRADRLSGTFERSRPLEDILSTIELSGGVTAVADGDGYVLRRAAK